MYLNNRHILKQEKRVFDNMGVEAVMNLNKKHKSSLIECLKKGLIGSFFVSYRIAGRYTLQLTPPEPFS